MEVRTALLVVFVMFCFALFFKVGFVCVALTALELAMN